MTNEAANFNVIEFSMMNKSVFFPLSGVGSFTVQTALYPLVLLRTRLQLQEGARVYRGLVHGFKCVLREEGFRGLYNGYMVKTAQLISGIFYATTYETVRDAAASFPNLTTYQRSFIGGAAASLVVQTLLVPIDVVSQHMMVLSRPINAAALHSADTHGRLEHIRSLSPIRLSSKEMASGWSRMRAVTSHVSKTLGIRGFYNGYLISLCTFVPSSAIWWSSYDKFCALIASVSSTVRREYHDRQIRCQPNASEPDPTSGLPRLLVQLIAAPLAGISAATLINPIDCIRVRMQVAHCSFRTIVRVLWTTEGLRWITKGLSARLIQTSIFSFWVILFYEPIKIFSLKEEYRSEFRPFGST